MADRNRDTKGVAASQGVWLTSSLVALNALIGILLIVAIGISITRTRLFTLEAAALEAAALEAAALEAAALGDYDFDDDGLIEVTSWAQLNAIRHDLDGNGNATDDAYAMAFPDALDGMGCPTTGCAGYELATDLDFDEDGDGQITSADATYWHRGRGWMPIGEWERPFAAVFQGNNYKIRNLFMDRKARDHVGLFARVDYTSRIEGVDLLDVKITGSNFVGGLVGDSRGAIIRSTVTGRVTGANFVGGLVGDSRDAIIRSTVTGRVTGANYVGGLVGSNSGAIADSAAEGAVAGARNYVGGLVGWNLDAGAIADSAAEGTVAGANYVGGLVGSNSGAIAGSAAEGTVAGARNYVGGLVGWNLDAGTIADSAAEGAVIGARNYVGGLVGLNGGTIADTAATGFVSGPADVGGLTGANYGAITKSAARGTVARITDAGGLADDNYYYGPVLDSVATDSVSGSADAGGLVGANYGAVTDSYWEFRYFDPVTSSTEPIQALRRLELAP